MPGSEWDKQRDIEAEGQRAAIYYAERDRAEAGSTLPVRHGTHRIVGIGPDGRSVDNVTENNRYSVDARQPWLTIALISEDGERTLKHVRIPNTRERPDVVWYRGKTYEVVTTNVPVPRYREVMALEAEDLPSTTTGDSSL